MSKEGCGSRIVKGDSPKFNIRKHTIIFFFFLFFDNPEVRIIFQTCSQDFAKLKAQRLMGSIYIKTILHSSGILKGMKEAFSRFLVAIISLIKMGSEGKEK